MQEFIDAKFSTFETYKCDAAKKMDKTVASYWSHCGHLCEKMEVPYCSDSPGTGDDSTIVFPGRKQVRPPFATDRKYKAECTNCY